MNFSLLARNYFTGIPLPIGQLISYIPFEIRPGIHHVYRKRKHELRTYENMDCDQKKKWIFNKIRNQVEYAVAKVPFYKSYYAEQKFNVEQLKGFDDIKRVPLINKNILRNYSLKHRSVYVPESYKVNTGGSSGNSLSFYVHADQMGNEWAHMHRIWEKLGYVPHHLKLSFGGRSDIKDSIQYDSVRHTIAVNIYADFETVLARIKKLVARHKVYYLHGYPSALYEFALGCLKYNQPLLNILQSQLKGAFLGSEFPLPLYRKTIENTFGIPTVSWYGHTERCILAYEKDEPYLYVPFQTYGYAEAVTVDGSNANLVGTSYNNFVSPLIRYDTEDKITDMTMWDGILTAFQVNDGRSGQFVVDRNGKKIPLTGLIFGRHHAMFNYCSHIQIFQPQPGKAVVLFVPHNLKYNFTTSDFDNSNVAIDFRFEQLPNPVRTTSGKINLLLTASDLERNAISIIDLFTKNAQTFPDCQHF